MRSATGLPVAVKRVAQALTVFPELQALGRVAAPEDAALRLPPGKFRPNSLLDAAVEVMLIEQKI